MAKHKLIVRPFLAALFLVLLGHFSIERRIPGFHEGLSKAKKTGIDFIFHSQNKAPEPDSTKTNSPDVKASGSNISHTPILLKVTRVVDGDTFVIENGEKIRLIGIDTPESRINKKLVRDAKKSKQKKEVVKEMGKQAALFTRKLLKDQKVRLEYDVQPRDKYGRILAYAYLEDGRFVNAEIMKAGFAQTMSIPPNLKYQGLFQDLQKQAREARKGLWS